jgi:hypothetical protein
MLTRMPVPALPAAQWEEGVGTKRARIGVLVAVTVVATIVLFLFDPIPQDPAYHQFADGRTWLGVPNFQNVAGNLPFLFVGIAGLLALRRARVEDVGARRGYAVFFVAVAGVAFGSGWYHLEPTTKDLFWDRLPMSVGFAGLMATVLSDRLGEKVGRIALWPLVAASVGTVLWWRFTEDAGCGDLRAYGLAQGLPLLWIVGLLLLFPGRAETGRLFAWLVAWYLAAKFLEHFDRQVFDATGGAVSGHALKHPAAAMATWQVVLMLRARQAPA